MQEKIKRWCVNHQAEIIGVTLSGILLCTGFFIGKRCGTKTYVIYNEVPTIQQ